MKRILYQFQFCQNEMGGSETTPGTLQTREHDTANAGSRDLQTTNFDTVVAAGTASLSRSLVRPPKKNGESRLIS